LVYISPGRSKNHSFHVLFSTLTFWREVDSLLSTHQKELENLSVDDRNRYLVQVNVVKQMQLVRDLLEVIYPGEHRRIDIHGFLYDRVRDRADRILLNRWRILFSCILTGLNIHSYRMSAVSSTYSKNLRMQLPVCFIYHHLWRYIKYVWLSKSELHKLLLLLLSSFKTACVGGIFQRTVPPCLQDSISLPF